MNAQSFTNQINAFIARVHSAVNIEQQTVSRIGLRFVNRVQQGFRNSRDPYGNTWSPITHRTGQPLIDTSRLRSSITFDVQGNDLKIGTPVHYARYHQLGTQHIKQRAFLPTRDLGLPAAWLADAVSEINEQIRRAMT